MFNLNSYRKNYEFFNKGGEFKSGLIRPLSLSFFVAIWSLLNVFFYLMSSKTKAYQEDTEGERGVNKSG